MRRVSRSALAIGFGVGSLLALRSLRQRGSYSFDGKSVLITGGSRGLGLVLARQLASEGARLSLVARTAVDLEQAAADVRARGGEVFTIPCDIRSRQQAEEAVARTVQQYGSLDVLINDAGTIQGGPLENMQEDDYADALAVHLWGPLYTMQAAIPIMRRQGGGRIVNVASIGGQIAVPHLVPYCASKFALVGLSDGMRAELAQHNILVTTVCPGLLRTGSHVNALFKGHQAQEYTLFSILDSLPLITISAEQAARETLEACRHAEAKRTTTLPARLGVILDALFPELTAEVMALAARLLPGPAGPEGDILRSGWESQTGLAPSLLTQPIDEAAAENNELRGHAPIA